MKLEIKNQEDVLSSIFDLSSTESNIDGRITTLLKLSFDKFIDDGKERYMFCLYSTKEYLKYKMVDRGQLDFDSFSRDEAIELWKAIGEVIKRNLK